MSSTPRFPPRLAPSEGSGQQRNDDSAGRTQPRALPSRGSCSEHVPDAGLREGVRGSASEDGRLARVPVSGLRLPRGPGQPWALASSPVADLLLLMILGPLYLAARRVKAFRRGLGAVVTPQRAQLGEGSRDTHRPKRLKTPEELPMTRAGACGCSGSPRPRSVPAAALSPRGCPRSPGGALDTCSLLFSKLIVHFYESVSHCR